MGHEHGPAMRETVTLTVAHCNCGAWKRTNGEWQPGPFGPVERLLTAILTAPPEVRALVARIVAGGPQAVEDVTEALRERGASICTDDGAADQRRAASERYVRLLELAGEEG